MKKRTLTAFLLILAVPRAVSARVIFTEIAWMGTPGSQFGEWVEFFNDGDAEVDLQGAVLYEGGGSTPILTLTKKISPRGYYLVERVTASSPDPIPGINDDSGAFGGGGLNNSGENLVLKAQDGTVLDQMNASLGWPGGDASTKETMQWSGTAWVTAPATPGVATSPGSGSVSSGGSGSSSSSGGDSALSAHAEPSLLAPTLKPRETLSVQAGRDRLGFVGVPLVFHAKAFIGENDFVRDPAFVWTFGDGGLATGAYAEHAYQFPGEYIVVLNGIRGEDRSTARARVKIVAPQLAITDVGQGARPYIEVANNAPTEVNLWKAVLRSGALRFEFPEDTIIAPGSRVAFPKEVTGLEPKPGDEIALTWPGGRVSAARTLGEELPPRKMAELQKTVDDLRSQIVERTSAPKVAVARAVLPLPAARISTPVSSSTILATTSAVVPRVIVEIPKSKGSKTGVFSWPGRTLAFIGEFLFGE